MINNENPRFWRVWNSTHVFAINIRYGCSLSIIVITCAIGCNVSRLPLIIIIIMITNIDVTTVATTIVCSSTIQNRCAGNVAVAVVSPNNFPSYNIMVFLLDLIPRPL